MTLLMVYVLFSTVLKQTEDTMRKFLIAAATLAALAVPVSVSAQSAVNAASCAVTVAKLQDNVGLRLQQYNGQTVRESIKAMLQAAANAAAAGNEASCWAYVKRARQ